MDEGGGLVLGVGVEEEGVVLEGEGAAVGLVDAAFTDEGDLIAGGEKVADQRPLFECDVHVKRPSGVGGWWLGWRGWWGRFRRRRGCGLGLPRCGGWRVGRRGWRRRGGRAR